MPHGRLCRARHDSTLAHQRAEGVPQCVNVENATALVALGDGSQAQIAVENLAQLVGHRKQQGKPRIGGCTVAPSHLDDRSCRRKCRPQTARRSPLIGPRPPSAVISGWTHRVDWGKGIPIPYGRAGYRTE